MTPHLDESASPSLRLEHRESTYTFEIDLHKLDVSIHQVRYQCERLPISSMKIMAGRLFLAIANKDLTNFSLSPCHFETKSEEETAKKVESASVATGKESKRIQIFRYMCLPNKYSVIQ